MKETEEQQTGNFFQNYTPQINNNSLNNEEIQNENYYQSNILSQNVQNQNNQTLLQRINTTASGVYEYIKSKTPTIPTITLPKNPLVKIDYNLILKEINTQNYEEEMKMNLNEVNCTIIQKSDLNNIDIVSKIENPRIIKDSYIKLSYVLYDIITEQFKWNVQRRYSDFIWLRDCLSAAFPMEIIPLLPKKKITNKRFESNFIEKRQKGLQQFLNEILTKLSSV